MENIMKFLKCKDKNELAYKFKESNELEIAELRETLIFSNNRSSKKTRFWSNEK